MERVEIEEILQMQKRGHCVTLTISDMADENRGTGIKWLQNNSCKALE